MRLPTRDIVATLLVALAGVVFLLWAVDADVPGLRSVRAAGTVVLVLGFAASASAVVPAFSGLLHGSKAYLAVTSAIGVAALVGGLMTLVAASEAGFALMIATMGALWLISTGHHWALARRAPEPRICSTCGRPLQQDFCEVCAYDLLAHARDTAVRLHSGVEPGP